MRGGELNFTVVVDAWSVEIFERDGKFACSAAIAEPVPEIISAINRGRVPVETEITRFLDPCKGRMNRFKGNRYFSVKQRGLL